MKALLHILLFSFLVGCASTPSQRKQSQLVIDADDKYAEVNRSMTQEEVYSLLGAPTEVLPDGMNYWRVAVGRQFAELKLKFDQDGVVTQLERRHMLRN